jgi:mRNA interferase RelE/StbE
MSTVELSNRARKDLRRIGPGPHRDRLARGLRALQEGASNLDIKAVEGHPPWLRLRLGEYRVLYRPTDGGWLVERIISRQELERAIENL